MTLDIVQLTLKSIVIDTVKKLLGYKLSIVLNYVGLLLRTQYKFFFFFNFESQFTNFINKHTIYHNWIHKNSNNCGTLSLSTPRRFASLLPHCHANVPQMQLKDEHKGEKNAQKFAFGSALSFNLFIVTTRVSVCVCVRGYPWSVCAQIRTTATPKQQQQQQWAAGQTMQILALNRIRIQNLLHLLVASARIPCGSSKVAGCLRMCENCTLVEKCNEGAVRPQRDGNCARIMHNDFINGLLCCSCCSFSRFVSPLSMGLRFAQN